MVGTAVFAITGVLAVTRRGLDVFGALVLGIVTALGGGTVRDLIIGAPPFWINDFNYVWAAGAGALRRISIGSCFGTRFAACCISMCWGSTVRRDRSGQSAVAPSQRTGGGGHGRSHRHRRRPDSRCAGWPADVVDVARDYATPILLGCIACALRGRTPPFPHAAAIGFTIIFGVRALAIHRHLEMPAWLTQRDPEQKKPT